MHMQIRNALLMVLFTSTLTAQTVTFKPYAFKANNGTVVDAEMGELVVRENRTKRDSHSIKLRFIRFKSTAAKPGNPIVYLAGGPGNSGIDAAESTRFALFMGLREFGDVIAWDVRGVGESEPDMRCDEEYVIAPGEPLDRTKAGAEVARAVRKCADRLRASGVDVSAYNNREAAADLEDLRKALGAPKLVLWTISYGSHLAIATMRFHPALVDRAIMAGIEGPDDTYKLPSDQQTLIEDIARLAAKDGVAPDLMRSMTNVLRELEKNPKRVPLTDPKTGRSTTYVLGPLDFQTTVADMLIGPDTFAGLPAFITRLERGDWTSLALPVAHARRSTPRSIMSVAMDCSAGRTEERRRLIANEAKRTLLADAIDIPFPEVCAGVNVPDVGDAYRGPLMSNVPVLLISGTLDGRTRPRQAGELRRTMPNAQHLIIEGAGHSDPLFLSSPKIFEAMKSFLRGEKLQERVITLPPVQFSPVRIVADVSEEVLARYVGTYSLGDKMKMRITKAGKVLYSQAGGTIALRPISETEFFSDEIAGTFRFEVDASGKPVALLFNINNVDYRAVRE
ncbi:MAG TPA: alpha/beta fold hydrolase [Thermoanaerobaculia bacterium]|nr:alpha/beta fold hydrolase [Thermoanaerobaculia bacterium]